MENIVVTQTDPRIPAVRNMISDLDRYQAALYPPESNHLEPVENLISADYYFMAAWKGRNLLGIASFRRAFEGYVEIKRLFVSPQFRGSGLAKRLMASLEQKAVQEGYTTARLETGIHQHAALKLYRKLGYEETGPFGSYQSDPLSVFMRKTLS